MARLLTPWGHFIVVSESCPETFSLAVLSSIDGKGSDAPGAQAWGTGPSPDASLSLPGQQLLVLIKMPSLWHWSLIGHLPEKLQPPHHTGHLPPTLSPQSDFSVPAFFTAAQRQMHQSFQGLKT